MVLKLRNDPRRRGGERCSRSRRYAAGSLVVVVVVVVVRGDCLDDASLHCPALLFSALLFSALHCSPLLSIALLCSALLVADVAGQGRGARDVGTIRARLAHDGWHAATVSMAEVTAVHASAILDVDRRRSTWCSRRPVPHAVFPPVTRSRDFIAFVPNWVVPTGLYRANRRIWGAFRSSEPRKPPPRPLIRSNS